MASKHKSFLRFVIPVLILLLLAAGGFTAFRFINMKTKTAAAPEVAVLQPAANQPVLLSISNPVAALAKSEGGKVTTLEWYLDGLLPAGLKESKRL